MPFQHPPRPVSVLAGVLATGLMLTVASCSHITPLGPDAAAAVPQPHHLRSPFVLQALRMQQPTSAGCPAGSAALSGGPGQCYRKTGTSVTVTSAGISQVSSFQPPTPPGQQAQPVQYGFWITLPAADMPVLTAVLTAVAPSSPETQGPVATSAADASVPAITVADRTWVAVGFGTRFADREFRVFLGSRNQALQLQRILAASG